VTVGRPSVDDVFVRLAERIGGDGYPPGSRLPSCRELAESLESNPSTVNRALHRLSEVGLVRTEPRRGTFVTVRAVPKRISDDDLVEALAGLVRWGRAGGIPMERMDRLFRQVVEGGSGSPRVGFVECNRVDAEALGVAVTDATGIAVEPLTIDDLGNGWTRRFDVLATPLFHMADVSGRIGGLDRVIDLVFLPASAPLRRLAEVDPSVVVSVASPTRRGLEVTVALVRQHFPGEVRPILVGDDGLLPDGPVDVLVFNNASRLRPDVLEQVPRPILLGWELDAGSAGSFPARVDAIVGASGSGQEVPVSGVSG
jgi:DNA-binding transcriptional regulator YhcF (GntR family)